MAGMQGFEPQLYDPESYVLPVRRHPSSGKFNYTCFLFFVNPPLLFFPHTQQKKKQAV